MFQRWRKLCEDENTQGSQKMCYLWCLFTTAGKGSCLRAGIPRSVPDFCLHCPPMTSSRMGRMRTDTVNTS